MVDEKDHYNCDILWHEAAHGLKQKLGGLGNFVNGKFASKIKFALEYASPAHLKSCLEFLGSRT
jgi:hypothetical protein